MSSLSYSGKVAFIGPTEFATGIWLGIELESAIGKTFSGIFAACLNVYYTGDNFTGNGYPFRKGQRNGGQMITLYIILL